MNLEDLKALLPESILEIAEIIGYPATLKLVEALGGVSFPFSKGVSVLGKARVDMLIQAVGQEAADKLMAHFGGEDLFIPRCAVAFREARNQRFIAELNDLRSTGTSVLMALSMLCPRYGFTDRFAWDLLNKRNGAQSVKQDSLF